MRYLTGTLKIIWACLLPFRTLWSVLPVFMKLLVFFTLPIFGMAFCQHNDTRAVTTGSAIHRHVQERHLAGRLNHVPRAAVITLSFRQ
jgi:hypothetical protein